MIPLRVGQVWINKYDPYTRFRIVSIKYGVVRYHNSPMKFKLRRETDVNNREYYLSDSSYINEFYIKLTKT